MNICTRFSCKFVIIYLSLLKIGILLKQCMREVGRSFCRRRSFVLIWVFLSYGYFFKQNISVSLWKKNKTPSCIKLVSFTIFGCYIVLWAKTIISWFCEIEADPNDQPILPFSLTKWANIIYGGRWWDFQDIKLRFMSGAHINLTTPLFGQFSQCWCHFLNISSL